MEIKCPRCGEPAQYTPENPFRPFCSERCKLIDLGHWADGKYAIPADDTAEDAPEAGDERDDADPSDDSLH